MLLLKLLFPIARLVSRCRTRERERWTSQFVVTTNWLWTSVQTTCKQRSNRRTSKMSNTTEPTMSAPLSNTNSNSLQTKVTFNEKQTQIEVCTKCDATNTHKHTHTQAQIENNEQFKIFVLMIWSRPRYMYTCSHSQDKWKVLSMHLCFFSASKLNFRFVHQFVWNVCHVFYHFCVVDIALRKQLRC
jgi:hypothetical protein